MEGMIMSNNMRERKIYLDIAKGIGILLVVLGHSFPDENAISGMQYAGLEQLKDFIY